MSFLLQTTEGNNPKREPEWKKTYGPHAFSIIMLAITIICGMLPLILNYAFLSVVHNPSTQGTLDLKTFINNGDIALFSASVLGPCVLLSFRYSGSLLKRIVNHGLQVATIIFICIIYNGIIVARITSGADQAFKLNEALVWYGSLISMLVACYIFFATTLREAKSAPHNYQDVLLDPDPISSVGALAQEIKSKVDKI